MFKIRTSRFRYLVPLGSFQRAEAILVKRNLRRSQTDPALDSILPQRMFKIRRASLRSSQLSGHWPLTDCRRKQIDCRPDFPRQPCAHLRAQISLTIRQIFLLPVCSQACSRLLPVWTHLPWRCQMFLLRACWGRLETRFRMLTIPLVLVAPRAPHRAQHLPRGIRPRLCPEIRIG